MRAKEISSSVYWVGAIDWDIRLFDALMPTPEGTSYNSYFIKGEEKNALVETVDPDFSETLLERLDSLNIDSIDYIIANHAEQDHSGSLPLLLDLFPDAKVVAMSKGVEILQAHLGLDEEDFIIVEDGDTISLGGKTLEFIRTPWVHWPETMVTYLREEKILFSCDLFGSHLATNDLYAGDEAAVLRSAKSYYAELMMPFTAQIKKHLEKIGGLELDFIAPSHGPVYNKPAFIIDAYKDWVSAPPKNLVLIPYISMHGSTFEMVQHLMDELTALGVKVAPFNLVDDGIDKLAGPLVDAATIVLGSPTVLRGPHPKMAYAAFLLNLLRPKAKYLSVIGSFGWRGKMVEVLQSMIPNLKLEVIDPVVIKGFPDEDAYQSMNALAKAIAEKHAELS